MSGVPPAKETAGLIEKETLQIHPRAVGADLAHPSVRSRPRTRSVWQRVSPAIVFDYEDEHDDEDDLNTLRMASQGGRPYFDFAIY